MINNIFLWLPMILIIGIITSISDIQKGKIKNKWIIISIIYFIVIQILILIFDKNFQMNYLINMLINILISLILGIIFWLNGIWSAADAKLFTAFTMLLPLYVYNQQYFIFPGLNILINSFMILSLFLIYQIIMKINEINFKKIIKKEFEMKKTIVTIFIILLTKILMSLLKIDKHIAIPLISIFAIKFLYFFMRKLLKKILNIKILRIVSLTLSLCFILLNYKIFNITFIKNYVLLTVVYYLIRLFVAAISAEIFNKTIKINAIEEGMVLTNSIYKTKSNKIKIISSNEKLTLEDIKKLKKIYTKKTIKIKQQTFFAPFLFVGVLLIILTSNNLLTLIFSLF